MRNECEDLQVFAETFFQHLLDAPWSRLHLDLFERLRRDNGKRDLHYATAAPRGNAKTTILGFFKPLQDVLYKREDYILICSANADLAKDKVKEIRDELESNAKLIQAYGPQQGSLWNQDHWISDTGVKVRAMSPGSKVRGFLWRGKRPSHILLDDAEDPVATLTALRRQRFLAWFQKDVSFLGASHTNFEIIGTVLHEESFLALMLKNPQYHARLYQAVESFATNPQGWKLWDQWRTLFTDLTNERRREDALAFFEAHKDIMLEGTKVLWPERQSYYSLMVTRLSGEAPFWQELMNAPQMDARRLFDMEAAAYCQVGPVGLTREDGRFIRYSDLTQIVAAYDPTPDRNSPEGDYASAVVLGEDTYGYLYVLDALCMQEASTDKQLEHVADMLTQWGVHLCSIESNAFAGLLVADLREKLAQRGLKRGQDSGETLVPVNNAKNKILRIRTLDPMIANRWLVFAETLPTPFFNQMAGWIPLEGAVSHDDAPDALEMAVRTAKRMF